MDFTVKIFALFLEAIVQQRHRRVSSQIRPSSMGLKTPAGFPRGTRRRKRRHTAAKGAAGNAAATLENPVAGCQGMALASALSRPHPELAGRLERVTQRLDPLLLAAEQGPVDRRVQLHGITQRPEAILLN